LEVVVVGRLAKGADFPRFRIAPNIRPTKSQKFQSLSTSSPQKQIKSFKMQKVTTQTGLEPAIFAMILAGKQRLTTVNY
jgi:hypothetical protein